LLFRFGGQGLPDFSCHNIPKEEKYTKQPYNILNVHKIDQINVKRPNGHKIYFISQCKILQNLPNWTFWLPSGNPVGGLKISSKRHQTLFSEFSVHLFFLSW
jgi:hypothetical protein